MAGAFDFTSPGALAQLIELTIGYGVGGAASRLADPFVQPAANLAWTNIVDAGFGVPVDAQTMARLVLLDYENAEDAEAEAANTGITPPRLYRYMHAMLNVPTVDQLLDLFRRNLIDYPRLAEGLKRGGLDPRYLENIVSLQTNVLGVADLAMARQQEFIDDAELHLRARDTGYNADDADLLYKMAGLPPGITVGLELLRRGKIDRARFAEYVAEGHTKTKYTDDLLELRYSPLSASIAAELLIRERIPEDLAVSIAEENGIRRDDFLHWSDGLGRPPGIGEALTIVNRGHFGDPNGAEARAFFRDVVARSDVRTEFADDLFVLRTHYPPLFQVERALTAGTITKAIAHDTLSKEGYPPEWVDAIVNAHANGAKGKSRDLSAAIIDTLYEAGLEDRPEAIDALEHLGYDEAEATQYLNLWLARRIVSELVRGVTLIRSRYTGWKIDRPATVRLLNELTNDGTLPDKLLPLWDAEREANAPVLTTAQIGEAMKYGRYTLEQALAAWQLLGFSADDALTHAWIVAKGDPGPATPAPA